MRLRDSNAAPGGAARQTSGPFNFVSLERLVRAARLLDVKRDLIGNTDAVAFEGNDFLGMVGEDADVAQAKINENLGADAAFVLNHALASRLAIKLAAAVQVNLREGARSIGRVHGEAAATVVEIEEDAATFRGDGFEGASDELSAVAGGRAENVAGETVRMDADESGLFAFEIAADERDVLIVVHVASVSDHAEIAEARGKQGLGDAADVAFMLHAVADEIRDGQHFQIVLRAELLELRHASHGAVFIHDFADDAARTEAGDAREVHARFGLAGANEHAAFFGAQGKDVAGASEILRLGLGINRRENGYGAVGGADASSDAGAGVNGFGKGRAMNGRVDGRHERKVQFVATVLGERETDETATVLGHEIDGVRSDLLGGHREVAFVFTIFVVHEDDHAALANVFDGFLDRSEVGAQVSHGKRIEAGE